MFVDIHEHMKLSRDERRSHLDLSSPCIEIGGDSTCFRSLLAHRLKTTIPKLSSKNRNGIQLCHACHNGKCSNTDHLYWGTQQDNSLDMYQSGTALTINERYLKKHGKPHIGPTTGKIWITDGRSPAFLIQKEKIDEWTLMGYHKGRK